MVWHVKFILFSIRFMGDTLLYVDLPMYSYDVFYVHVIIFVFDFLFTSTVLCVFNRLSLSWPYLMRFPTVIYLPWRPINQSLSCALHDVSSSHLTL